MKKILAQHEKDLAEALNKHNSNKDRQLEELKRRLADKRRQKEQQLKQKHTTEV